MILIMGHTPRGLYTFQALSMLPGDPGNQLSVAENPPYTDPERPRAAPATMVVTVLVYQNTGWKG